MLIGMLSTDFGTIAHYKNSPNLVASPLYRKNEPILPLRKCRRIECWTVLCRR